MSYQSKGQLRKIIKAGLQKIGRHDITAQTKLIEKALFQDQRFLAACSVGLFMSMPFEIDTQSMIEYCFENGKKLYLPKCSDTERGRMDFLQVESIEEVLAMQPRGPYNLREPTASSTSEIPQRLDVIIVPGVAFTSSGCRLGHGGGYYDRFLNRHQERHGTLPYLIGIGLAQQMVSAIPMDNHDRLMDRVISGQDS